MQTHQKHSTAAHGRGNSRPLFTGLGLLLVSTVAAAIWLTVPAVSTSHRQITQLSEPSVNLASSTGEVDQSNLAAAPALAGTVLKDSTMDAIDP